VELYLHPTPSRQILGELCLIPSYSVLGEERREGEREMTKNIVHFRNFATCLMKASVFEQKILTLRG
jgi:hypothetical protein